MKQLFCARLRSKHFKCLKMFSPYHNPLRWVLVHLFFRVEETEYGEVSRYSQHLGAMFKARQSDTRVCDLNSRWRSKNAFQNSWDVIRMEFKAVTTIKNHLLLCNLIYTKANEAQSCQTTQDTYCNFYNSAHQDRWLQNARRFGCSRWISLKEKSTITMLHTLQRNLWFSKWSRKTLITTHTRKPCSCEILLHLAEEAWD